MDCEERKDDLVQDMREVQMSFSARLYGRRSAANKAKKAIEAWTMASSNSVSKNKKADDSDGLSFTACTLLDDIILRRGDFTLLYSR
jgi:hypothetical protein